MAFLLNQSGYISNTNESQKYDNIHSYNIEVTKINGLDISRLGELLNLTEAEIKQLENINETTISPEQWQYLGSLDQSLDSKSNVEFRGLDLTGNLTINNNELRFSSDGYPNYFKIYSTGGNPGVLYINSDNDSTRIEITNDQTLFHEHVIVQDGNISLLSGDLLLNNENITISNLELQQLDGLTQNIENSLNTNATNISTNSAAINNNTTNINTNTTDISTNSAAIASNLTAINTNTSDIATNTTAINTNTSDIATNLTSINTNASNIATNTTNIASNLTSINTNSAAIASNTTDISTNLTSINTNATNISTNTSNIASNLTAINNNTTNINTNTTDISTNTSDIATNTTAINTNTTNISTNSAAIASNLTSINTNASNIATNTTDIASNLTSINTNASNIATNTSNIATNLTSINTNTTAIASNTTHRNTTSGNPHNVQKSDLSLGITDNVEFANLICDQLTATADNHYFGTNDTNGQTILHIYGGETPAEGAELRLYKATDFDSPYNFWRIDSTGGNLRIGNAGESGININESYDISGINNITFSGSLISSGTTLSGTELANLDGLDQKLSTTSDVEFNNIQCDGNLELNWNAPQSGEIHFYSDGNYPAYFRIYADGEALIFNSQDDATRLRMTNDDFFIEENCEITGNLTLDGNLLVNNGGVTITNTQLQDISEISANSTNITTNGLNIITNQNNITDLQNDKYESGDDINCGSLEVGTEDSKAGIIKLYGSSNTGGGELRLYNEANNDSKIDYWTVKSDDDSLRIGTNVEDLIYINPDNSIAGLIASNSYTPDINDLSSNLSAVPTPSSVISTHYWMRIGNIVDVSGKITINLNNNPIDGTTCLFSISIPVEPTNNFTNPNQCSGNGVGTNGSSLSGNHTVFITAKTASKRVNIVFENGSDAYIANEPILLQYSFKYTL